MPAPMLSIVIPALDEAVFLPRLLKDLSKQDCKDFEVIVVDGGSTDATVAKAKAFGVKVLETKLFNVSAQRNLGGTKAKAEWILFFDADNRVRKDFVKLLTEQLETLKSDAFTTFIHPDSSDPRDITITTAYNLISNALAKLNNPVCFGLCIGVKKSVFEAVEGFNPKVRFQEDVDFSRRVAKAGFRFEVLEKPSVTMSFRRFRTEGHMRVLRKASVLQLKNFLYGFETVQDLKNYPMLGGKYYKVKSRAGRRFERKAIQAMIAKYSALSTKNRQLISYQQYLKRLTTTSIRLAQKQLHRKK